MRIGVAIHERLSETGERSWCEIAEVLFSAWPNLTVSNLGIATQLVPKHNSGRNALERIDADAHQRR
jgi:hypothetical protein